MNSSEKGMTEAEARIICERKELDPDKIVCVYLGHGPHPQWMDFLDYPAIWGLKMNKGPS